MAITRISERTQLLRLLTGLITATLAVYGQSQTGQISGVVADQSGAIVGRAKVQLIHELTQNTRDFTTEANGVFVFTNLIPGEYTIRIEQPGFKTYEQAKITVSPSERVDLHQITLVIGRTSESIVVTAEAARVQTSSSE